jgi:HSP20 family protein
MTDPTAVPINIFENEREVVVTAPMPGVAPEDISVDVTARGLTVRARQHGPGQERIEYLLREWSYGPFERRVDLPRDVDGMRANLTYGNGVLTIVLPKTDATAAASGLTVDRTGHTRGTAMGHTGSRGGAAAD